MKKFIYSPSLFVYNTQESLFYFINTSFFSIFDRVFRGLLYFTFIITFCTAEFNIFLLNLLFFFAVLLIFFNLIMVRRKWKIKLKNLEKNRRGRIKYILSSGYKINLMRRPEPKLRYYEVKRLREEQAKLRGRPNDPDNVLGHLGMWSLPKKKKTISSSPDNKTAVQNKVNPWYKDTWKDKSDSETKEK